MHKRNQKEFFIGSPGFHLNAGFDGGSLATYRERIQASGGGERFRFELFSGVENVFNQRYYENGFLAPRALGRGGVNIRF
jgi:outer membrane receptor protein involved in Fe transport